MEVRDPIHGSIRIRDEEKPIIAHPFFQRLRSIKQLGFSEYVFPGATHTRYLHSIGVMDVSEKVFNQIFKSHEIRNPEVQKLKNAKIKRAKELYKEGYKKTDILKIIIKEFKLERDLSSRSWPKWLSDI